MKTKHGQSQLPEIALPWLVVAELATWIGASFIWPLTSVYLNKRLGISLSVIGIVLFCNCAANMLGSTISGRLFDRLNPYPLITGGMLLDALVLLAMAFFHGWPVYWVWLACTGFLGGWNGALVNSIATSLRKYPGRYVFNILYFSQNLGVVIGTLIVGYLYDYSIELLFIIASCLFLIGALVAFCKFKPIVAYHARRQEQKKTGQTPLKAEKMPKANFWMTMGFFITLGVTLADVHELGVQPVRLHGQPGDSFPPLLNFMDDQRRHHRGRAADFGPLPADLQEHLPADLLRDLHVCRVLADLDFRQDLPGLRLVHVDPDLG